MKAVERPLLLYMTFTFLKCMFIRWIFLILVSDCLELSSYQSLEAVRQSQQETAKGDEIIFESCAVIVEQFCRMNLATGTAFIINSHIDVFTLYNFMMLLMFWWLTGVLWACLW